MSLLIICLPAAPILSDSVWHFATTSDGQRVSSEGTTFTSDLRQHASHASQVLVVVPASALSWHRVLLPPRVAADSVRMRAVLGGLLEDQLLDDPGSLHFSLPPAMQAGTPQWVAVCDQHWLAQALKVLSDAHLTVTRIVPEWEPRSHQVQWHVYGTQANPLLLVGGPEGVSLFPLTPEAIKLAQGLSPLDPNTSVSADPELVVLAAERLQRPVTSLTRAEKSVAAAQSSWNLAQFDFASSPRLRLQKRLHQEWQDWRQAPRWRGARWGVALLLGTNLLGLNGVAWQAQRQLDNAGKEVIGVLNRSFPGVNVVVDAPLQMAREVRLLELATGIRADDSLEAMLDGLGTATAAGSTLQSVDYSAGELRVKGSGLSAAEGAALKVRLQARGYVATAQGNTLVLQGHPVDRRAKQ